MQEARPTAQMTADAYSLLGAYFVDDNDMHRATTYWLKSISIRTAEPTTDPDGPLSAPNPAYNYAREVRDVDSLMTIAGDDDAMFMQVLSVFRCNCDPFPRYVAYYPKFKQVT